MSTCVGGCPPRGESALHSGRRLLLSRHKRTHYATLARRCRQAKQPARWPSASSGSPAARLPSTSATQMTAWHRQHNCSGARPQAPGELGRQQPIGTAGQRLQGGALPALHRARPTRVASRRSASREFCKAYAYETLPPVLDLAAAALGEGSNSRRVRMARDQVTARCAAAPASHRCGQLYFFEESSAISPGASSSYAVNYALLHESRTVCAHMDVVELLVLNVFQLIRTWNGVVATKYAYFEEEDLESMTETAILVMGSTDFGSCLHVERGLIAANYYAGLLRGACPRCHGDGPHIDLRAVDVAIDEDSAAAASARHVS